uniref:Serine and arginine rich splicing factor 2a n=1 Tax=Tetraodon nigroviridis TaxID=99883 RepID=H3C0G5_TETNG
MRCSAVVTWCGVLRCRVPGAVPALDPALPVCKLSGVADRPSSRPVASTFLPVRATVPSFSLCPPPPRPAPLLCLLWIFFYPLFDADPVGLLGRGQRSVLFNELYSFLC